MDTVLERIRNQEQRLGLTKLNYQAKFVLKQEYSVDAFYYSQTASSPSRAAGFTYLQEQKVKGFGCLIIIQAGVFLKLPVTTVIVAQSILHFFYQKIDLIQYDIRDAAMGALFLATQSQETLRRTAHIALVFDQIFKIHEKSRRPTKIADVQSKEFKYLQARIVEMEKVILIELGFETYRIAETPHRYMNPILQLFSKHPQLDRIAPLSWGFLNDSYRSSVCLYYPGHIIAASCIFLSLRKLNLGVGKNPWWCLLEANVQIMEDVCVYILDMYEQRTDYLGVQSIVSDVGKKNNLQDVFIVPYLRKFNHNTSTNPVESRMLQTGQSGRDSRQRSREKRLKTKCSDNQNGILGKLPRHQKEGMITQDIPESSSKQLQQQQSSSASILQKVNLQFKVHEKKIEQKLAKVQQEKIKESESAFESEVSMLAELRKKFLSRQGPTDLVNTKSESVDMQ